MSNHHRVFLQSLRLLEEEHFFPRVPEDWKLEVQEELGILEDGHQQQCIDPSILGCTHTISSELKKLRAEYDADINVKVIPHECIQGCTSFDVISLLSSHERDYLVRNDGTGEQVNVEKCLRDKFVMVCCFFAPLFWVGGQAIEARAVSSMCIDLYEDRSDVEVVIVAKMRPGFDEADFDHFLSGFPSTCLTVPYWDSDSRDCICRFLDFTSKAQGLFVDPHCTVLWHKDFYFSRRFGADAFPFTDERMSALIGEENGVQWKELSLDKLLCSNSSDVLGKYPGGGLEKVSISELKEKLVGVYLCGWGDFIPELDKVCDFCRAQGKELEIIVVYLPFHVQHHDPQLFQDMINRALLKRNVSWWVLPFRSWVSRKLDRLAYNRIKHSDDRLIIVGPHGRFVDPNGAFVIKEYGLDSTYPFSREAVFQNEVQRIKTVTLESLLVYGSRDYLLRGNNEADRVPVAELRDRNIFLYLDCGEHLNSYLYGTLSKFYYEIKAKDPGFEVVFVNSGSRLSSCLVKQYAIPWLVCPFEPDHSDLVSKTIFKDVIVCTLVAFGKDGNIRSIRADRLLSSHGIGAYPFFGNDLRKEVIAIYHSRNPRLQLAQL